MYTPAPASRFGCSGWSTLLFTILLVIGCVWLISETRQPRQQAWDGLAFGLTASIPAGYIAGLAVGRWQLGIAAPDRAPNNPFLQILRHLRTDRIEQLFIALYSIILLVTTSTIGWLIFMSAAESLTVPQLQHWSLWAITGCSLATGCGYWLGRAYMEDRRRFVLALLGPLLLFFLVPSLGWLAEHYQNLSLAFWLGVPLGSISILITWGYLSEGWDARTLSWRGSLLDGCLMHCAGSVQIIMLCCGMIGLSIGLQSRDWMQSSLLPWLLFVLSYMLVKTWWHRPTAPPSD